MAISADYVHAFSRDMLMSKDLNAGLRATTVATSTLSRTFPQPELVAAYAVLNAEVSRVCAPSPRASRSRSTSARSTTTRCSSRSTSGSAATTATRVSYTLAYSRGNTSGNGVAASGFQVLDDMHLELNEGPTAFDMRHNFVVSGQALVPRTGGLNVSWVVRALSGSPFSLTNTPDRSRSQRLAVGAAGGRRLQRHRDRRGPVHREGLQGPAQRRVRPGLLQRRHAVRLPLRPAEQPPHRAQSPICST